MSRPSTAAPTAATPSVCAITTAGSHKPGDRAAHAGLHPLTQARLLWGLTAANYLTTHCPQHGQRRHAIAARPSPPTSYRCHECHQKRPASHDGHGLTRRPLPQHETTTEQTQRRILATEIRPHPTNTQQRHTRAVLKAKQP